ncbi:MAG: hypothetical protein ACYCX4_07290 [Bacillota bacterium]
MKKTLKRTIGYVLIVILLLFWAESKVIFQEGNPIPLVLAISKLHLTGSSLERISNREMYIVRSKDGNEPYIDYMEKQGWKFVEQLGAGLVFEKHGTKIVSTSRMYSRFYMVIKR